MIFKQHPNYLRLKRNFKNFGFFSKKKNIHFFFGILGIKVCESGRLFFSEIEAVRRTLQGSVKSVGKLYIRIAINSCITKKSVGSRMGRGKGAIKGWYCFVSSGSIIIEIRFYNRDNIYKLKKILLFSLRKIALKTKVITFML